MNSRCQEKSILESCVNYFKNNQAYKRIFSEMRRKWKIYGKASGLIVIKNASAEEKEALQSLTGISYDKKDINFHMSEFESDLHQTKFKEIGLQDLLEGYFAEKLTTNKYDRQEKYEEKQLFFESILNVLANDKIKYEYSIKWLEQVVIQKKFGYALIIAEYEKEDQAIKKIIFDVCRAICYINTIGNNKIRLAVLSAEITFNPHYFDRENNAGKLLIYALSFINGCEYPHNAESILELYYMSKIKPDDISSYTTVYGISLFTEDGVHKAYETFIENNESYVVTLSNLNRIVKASCSSKQIFIFENQMVFSHMCESLSGIPVSMICTSGQMKTASLIIIDLLCEAGYTLYYSGDIDPEGICIADRVITRDPQHIIPWMLNKDDYELSISDEKLDESRIRKIEKLQSGRFSEVIKALINKKRAGYQELLIDKMLCDIKEKIIS